MKISLDKVDAGYSVVGYGPGEVIVTGRHEGVGARPDDKGRTTLTRSLLISPKTLRTDWPPQSMAELQSEHLEMALALQPQLVLIGTGPTMRFPTPRLLAPVIRAGVGYEVMDTPAACRTYNILANESRAVVAALIIG